MQIPNGGEMDIAAIFKKDKASIIERPPLSQARICKQ